jgi:CRISPR-associated endonuclease/helicase Cas3
MMELLVLSPEPFEAPPADWLGGAFKGTSHVYEDAAVLWRTVRALAEVRCIETPRGLRALIERVYDPDAEPPTSLLPSAQRAAGRQGADAAAAIFAVLKAPDGYHADAVAWVNDMRVPTRLGDLRTTLRLARVRADGGLEPWVRAHDGAPWKSWALSEVSVSAYRAPPGSMPEPRFAGAVERLRNGWGRFEQDVPVVVLAAERAGDWRGTLTTPGGKIAAIGYTESEGLAFSRAALDSAR